jgi:hypothetical protein
MQHSFPPRVLRGVAGGRQPTRDDTLPDQHDNSAPGLVHTIDELEAEEEEEGFGREEEEEEAEAGEAEEVPEDSPGAASGGRRDGKKQTAMERQLAELMATRDLLRSSGKRRPAPGAAPLPEYMQT